MTYAFHEVADIFPLMRGEEFAQLVNDIREHGLREPIWLYQDKIIDGRNRYRACELAGREPEFREWDGEGSLVAFVLSLNLHRRHLDETGRATAGAKIKPFLAKEARERQGQRTDISANLRGSAFHKASEDAARLVNVSPRLIESADKVLKEATPELAQAMEHGMIPASRAEQLVSASPEFQKAVVKKLESGEVTKPTEAIRQVKKEALPDVSLPLSKYRVLYADPPWEYGDTRAGLSGYSAAVDHYPTMSLEELCALPVEDIADENAVLFLWVPAPLLEVSFQVVRAWSFLYKTHFIWDKVKHNVGHYNSVRHELLLLCTRGSCLPDVTHLFDSVQSMERTTHSTKPAQFREIIDVLYPYGKRLELFAREEHSGWESYGNEVRAVPTHPLMSLPQATLP